MLLELSREFIKRDIIDNEREIFDFTYGNLEERIKCLGMKELYYQKEA
jgi:hypothetical protein